MNRERFRKHQKHVTTKTSTIVTNIKKEKKLKLSKFGTFSVREKKQRIGRNPKTKESKMISSRDVVLFKPSKEFKEFVNLKDNG